MGDDAKDEQRGDQHPHGGDHGHVNSDDHLLVPIDGRLRHPPMRPDLDHLDGGVVRRPLTLLLADVLSEQV